jgi:hypothetical protein
MVSARQVDHVQAEGSAQWVPVAHSPFAAYWGAPTAKAPVVPAKPALSGAQWLFIVGSLLLLGVGAAVGWLGVLAGLGIAGWSIARYRAGQPSLMDLAWGKPRGLPRTALTVGLGLFTAFCGATSLLAEREATAKKEQVAKAQEAAARKDADDRKALVAALPAKLSDWRQRMNDVSTLADKSGPEAARDAASAIVTEATTYEKMLAPQSSPELVSGRAELEARAKTSADWVTLLDNVRSVTEQTSAGKTSAKNTQWLAADDAYAAALSALDQIQAADAALAAHLPATFKPTTERASVEQLKKAIAPQVTAERKRLEREEAQRKARAAKAEAYAALCGEKPLVSSWSGEVVGLESTLKETANDPDSIDVDKCTDPKLTTDNCWLVTCNVRGKNAFGALILLRKTYYYSKALGFQEAH